jgi:maleylacetoacetate isomerase
MIPPLTLYHYWRSSSSWRVRWALEIKGLKAELVHVGLLNGESESEEHLKRNPLGYVPVLKAGDEYFTESVAIIEWLDEMAPTPKLYPGDSYERLHIRTLCEIINAGIQPIQNTLVLDKLSSEEEKRKEWSQFFIRRGLHAFEENCKKKSGKFSVGDQVTAADVFLIPQLYNAKRVDIDLKDFPLLAKIYENALKTEACKASQPEAYEPK